MSGFEEWTFVPGGSRKNAGLGYFSDAISQIKDKQDALLKGMFVKVKGNVRKEFKAFLRNLSKQVASSGVGVDTKASSLEDLYIEDGEVHFRVSVKFFRVRGYSGDEDLYDTMLDNFDIGLSNRNYWTYVV